MSRTKNVMDKLKRLLYVVAFILALRGLAYVTEAVDPALVIASFIALLVGVPVVIYIWLGDFAAVFIAFVAVATGIVVVVLLMFLSQLIFGDMIWILLAQIELELQLILALAARRNLLSVLYVI